MDTQTTKATITNKTYLAVLWTLIMLTYAIGAYAIIMKFSFIQIISMTWMTVILILLLTGNKHLATVIKIGTGLTIAGCSLQFLSLFFRLVGQAFEDIVILAEVENTIQFAIALYLFKGASKYITFPKENKQVKTQKQI